MDTQLDALLILGNQLFPSEHLPKSVPVFMREDEELCTYYKFHKHKIILFLAAMRGYAEELTRAGHKVTYQKMGEKAGTYETALADHIKQKKIKRFGVFEIEDKFFEARIAKLTSGLGVELVTLPSPMFLTSREEFKAYLKKYKRPFMKTFYEGQRKRLNILVDKQGKPIGGKWSFDTENRLALPKDLEPPPLAFAKPDRQVKDVIKLVNERFSAHPGDANGFWLPTTRQGAHLWLEKFLDERLREFGPYEDAIPERSDFLYHSVLTPFLNTGLLTPAEVVERTLEYAKRKKLPMASVEGFIRQIIGWREFIRGIYQSFSEKQETTNFFKHKAKLKSCWWTGTTGIPPLDNTIRKVNQYAYAHHIERLMVAGSLMVLLEVDPKEAHRWFMELFIDSSDWVMGPNVYGMALFSDGGIFATKPYICGSNYYRKMGGYKAAAWCDGVDGLYWRFIEKNKTFFSKNPRLSVITKSVEKMDPSKKRRIYLAADSLTKSLVD